MKFYEKQRCGMLRVVSCLSVPPAADWSDSVHLSCSGGSSSFLEVVSTRQEEDMTPAKVRPSPAGPSET